MIVKEIDNKSEYNITILDGKHSQFLQSWQWGGFLQSEGKKIIRLGFYDNDKLFFVVSLFKNHLPLGFCYFSIPRINISALNEKQLSFVVDEIRKVTKKDKVLFLRLEPISQFPNFPISQFPLKKTIDVQPRKTLILDLNKTEEELLSRMHQKTRYNIRLAERKGVVIREVGDVAKDFEKFWNLMEDTGGRDGFKLHGREHYRKMLKISDDDVKIKLYFAEYKGEIVTANIVSFFGDMATYVHGASSNKHRNVMAPYLLQWQVIKTAKELGYKSYDFFGIDEKKWPGVTRFKRGFFGEEIKYPGTFDLIFNNYFYCAYKILRKIRRRF